MRKKNQLGFTVIEVMFFVLVALIIAGAIFFVGKRMGKMDTKPETAVSQNTSTADDGSTANWKTFEDKRNKVSFKYPSDWKVDITKSDASVADDGKGDFLGGTVTSPSGKVSLGYSNFIAGLGGGSCPDDFPCPTIDILALSDVSGLKGAFQYIEKITYWKGNGDGYTPAFGLIDADTAKSLKVGSIQRNDFYLTAAFTDDGGQFALNFAPNSGLADFKTYEAAKAYLDSPEAKTAKQIIKSTTQK
jgi:hypothetical protein